MLASSILHRSVWDELEDKQLTMEQRVKYIEEVGKTTKEHFKVLYFFDTEYKVNNITKK